MKFPDKISFLQSFVEVHGDIFLQKFPFYNNENFSV